VLIVDREAASADSPRAWLESVARDRRIDGAIDVIGGAHLEAADIWVFPPPPRASKVTRAPVEREVENAPARLAIRATDLMRSLLIENDLLGAPHAPAHVAIAAAAAPPAAGGAGIGLELGAAMLASAGGVGPAILPLVRLDGSVGTWLGIQAEAAAFGTRPTIGTGGATAQVAHAFGLLGVCACARAAARWRPVVGLAAGVLHTAADGRADPPLQAHAVAQWSFLLEATAGVRLRLAERTHLTLSAHVQLAQPYLDIRVANAGSATSGRPNLLVSLAVGQWL
jgi:hypothetical protein